MQDHQFYAFLGTDVPLSSVSNALLIYCFLVIELGGPIVLSTAELGGHSAVRVVAVKTIFSPARGFTRKAGDALSKKSSESAMADRSAFIRASP